MQNYLMQVYTSFLGFLTQLEQIDVMILNWIQDVFKNSTFDFLFPIITALGNIGIIWIILTIVLICIKKYRLYGIMLGVALLLSLVLCDMVIKPFVARPRPFTTYSFTDLLIGLPTSFSFPSGHTFASFASAFIVLKANKQWGLFAYILAGLIAFSRMYLLVHYPSDVIVGVILGTLTGMITYICLKQLKRLRYFNN